MQILTTPSGTPGLTGWGKAQLHVSHGNLQYLKKGDILQVHVAKIIQGKAQVNIRGERVTLEGLSKRLQNKTITLEVLKEGKHPQLELQAQAPRPLSSSMEKPAMSVAPPFTWPAGKIIAATVERRLNSGHIILQWRNRSFEAPAPAHIQAGDLLLLQVGQTGKMPELHVLDHLAQTKASRLTRHRGSSGPEPQNIRHHGLKALLLDLIENSRQQWMTSEIVKTTHASRQGAARVESQQVLNLIASMQTDPIRFELPMFIGGQLISVYLSIQQEQRENHDHGGSNARQNQNKQSYNILFALDLAGLGALRIDARISPASVYANFYHDSDAARQFVQHNIRRLEGKLHSLGYQGIYLGTAPAKQMAHEKNTQFEQLINNAPGSDGLLDIRG